MCYFQWAFLAFLNKKQQQKIKHTGRVSKCLWVSNASRTVSLLLWYKKSFSSITLACKLVRFSTVYTGTTTSIRERHIGHPLSGSLDATVSVQKVQKRECPHGTSATPARDATVVTCRRRRQLLRLSRLQAAVIHLHRRLCRGCLHWFERLQCMRRDCGLWFAETAFLPCDGLGVDGMLSQDVCPSGLVSVCLSVRLSHAGILSKRLNISSNTCNNSAIKDIPGAWLLD